MANEGGTHTLVKQATLPTILPDIPPPSPPGGVVGGGAEWCWCVGRGRVSGEALRNQSLGITLYMPPTPLQALPCIGVDVGKLGRGLTARKGRAGEESRVIKV